MECVRSAHVSVLVNGSPTGNFQMERGLRQGDPLSPFLFVLAAEGISLMMEKAAEMGLFKPMEVGRRRIEISHLQFVDDTLFLGDALEGNILFLKILLILLELVSGLKINTNKCNVYGINTDEEWLEQQVNILECSVGRIPFTYLGVKVGISHNKVSDWRCIVQKVRNRVRKWESLKISIGGRLTLINSVLSSLSVFLLSIYRGPKKVLSEIVKIQRSFLWGVVRVRRKSCGSSGPQFVNQKILGALGLGI